MRMRKIKRTDFDRFLLKNEILSSQYKSDIVNGARQGFGGLSLKGRAEMGCAVDADETIHEQSLAKVRKAHEFSSGVNIKNDSVVKVSAREAFKQAQKGKCGFIYANAPTLKKLLNAAKNANLAPSILPVWTSRDQLARREKELREQEFKQYREEKKRQDDLKGKQIEDQKEAAAKEAGDSERQRQYRETHGAKVASLVAGIRRSVLSSNKNWKRLNRWRAKHKARGWQVESIVARPIDYGFAKWKGRNIEAIVAEVRFTTKNRDLGKNEEICWPLGYLNDTEFDRSRDPIDVRCSKKVEIKKWKIGRAFDTRWQLLGK